MKFLWLLFIKVVLVVALSLFLATPVNAVDTEQSIEGVSLGSKWAGFLDTHIPQYIRSFDVFSPSQQWVLIKPGLSAVLKNNTIVRIRLIPVENAKVPPIRCIHGFFSGQDAKMLISLWGKPPKVQMRKSYAYGVGLIITYFYTYPAWRHRFWVVSTYNNRIHAYKNIIKMIEIY